jgi:large subunit ribosomal protein L30
VSPDRDTRATASAGAAAALRVTQVRSSISSKPKHRGTLRALGLRGVGNTRVLPDRPEIRGMLARVPHLVEVEPASSGDLAAEQARLGAVRAQHRAAEHRGAAPTGPGTASKEARA